MDSTAFLARVEDYHKAGWRLALINVTTVMTPTAAPVHGGHAAAAPAAAVAPAAAPVTAETPAVPAPADTFEIAWAFARGAEFETWRETIDRTDAVPSISEFFGAAFLYENEIRELFGINLSGIRVDLKGQLYKTATRVPFSHAAVNARLAAVTAAAAAAAAPVKKA